MTDPLPARRDADLAGSGIACGIFLVLAAAWLWRGGQVFWAVVCVLGAAGLPWMVRQSWEAECSSCPQWLKINFGTSKYARCKSCYKNGYYLHQDGRFVPVPPDTVGTWQDFEVYLWDLASERAFALPYDGGCCVCRKPAVKGTMVRLAASEGGVPGVYQNIRSIELEIPHCPEHGSGVGGSGGIGLASYEYWREFLRLNGR